MVAYRVWIKLKGGGKMSCESKLSDKGKQIIDGNDISDRRVYRRILK